MRSALVLLTLALLAPGRETLAQSSGAGREGTGSPAEFWQSLGDRTLELLVAEALAANPDVRAAEAGVRAARAGRVQATLELAPVVTASSGYSRQRFSTASLPGVGAPLPDQDIWEAGVQLSWELDVFGRGRRALRGRGALLSSAEEDVRGVQVLLAAEVARAYFELRGAESRLEVARRNAENQRRTLDLTLVRLEAGRGTALDTERAQAQLSSTLAVIPVLEAAIAASRHRIATLLGRPPASLTVEPEAESALKMLPAAEVAVSPEALVRQRPDLRSAERQLAARAAFVAAARTEYLPRVSIGGMAGYTATALESLGNSGTPRYVIGPVVSWPLFDLARIKAGVDAARAGEADAAARYEQAKLRALEEVETSLVEYRRAHERLSHLEDAAAASERATELARLRFEEGATGFLEVLDAERTLLEAQDRLAAGRTEATTGLVAVYQALGGRWPSEAIPSR